MTGVDQQAREHRAVPPVRACRCWRLPNVRPVYSRSFVKNVPRPSVSVPYSWRTTAAVHPSVVLCNCNGPQGIVRSCQPARAAAATRADSASGCFEIPDATVPIVRVPDRSDGNFRSTVVAVCRPERCGSLVDASVETWGAGYTGQFACPCRIRSKSAPPPEYTRRVGSSTSFS